MRACNHHTLLTYMCIHCVYSPSLCVQKETRQFVQQCRHHQAIWVHHSVVWLYKHRRRIDRSQYAVFSESSHWMAVVHTPKPILHSCIIKIYLFRGTLDLSKKLPALMVFIVAQDGHLHVYPSMDPPCWLLVFITMVVPLLHFEQIMLDANRPFCWSHLIKSMVSPKMILPIENKDISN